MNLSLYLFFLSLPLMELDAFHTVHTNKGPRTSLSMYLTDGNQAAKKTIPAELSSAWKQHQKDTSRIGTLRVPNVGIGTISWSSESLLEPQNPNIEELVHAAMDSEDVLIDTAERYGGNLKTALGLGWGDTERMTRKFVESAPGMNRAVIATKFTPSPWRKTAKSVVEACEMSIKRLGVEKIDLYQLHMPDVVRPLGGRAKDEIYWEGLAECYKRGLVSNVGVSNYGPTMLGQCQDALGKRGVPLASNQIAYSLLGRKNGAQETLDACKKSGVRVLACYPFAMGLLTGKYSEKGVGSLMENGKTKLERDDLERYAKGDGKKVPRGGISPLLNVLKFISEKRNKTVAQVSLNYIICKGAIPIPGARTELQVADNLGAMGWRLTPYEIAMLELEADNLGFEFEGAGFKRTSEKFVGYGTEKWSLD